MSFNPLVFYITSIKSLCSPLDLKQKTLERCGKTVYFHSLLRAGQNPANYEKLLMFPLSMKYETVFNEKEDVYCYKLPCFPGALKKGCL